MRLVHTGTGEIVGEGQGHELALLDGHFRFTPTGLEVVGNPTFDNWMTCGLTLKDIKQGLHFAIGDWLIYGRDRWPDRYAQGMSIFGFSYQTLSTDVWVAEGFEHSRRRECPHSYHREVRPLSRAKQDEILDKAIEEEWDRETIRDKVREIRNPEPKTRGRRIETVQLSCDLLHQEWGGKAAVEFSHTDGGNRTYCPGWKSLYRMIRAVRDAGWKCQPLDTYGMVGWIARRK